MDTNDRKAIDDLFGKLGNVERQAGPRDAEAEAFITERLSHQPGAPYYMAQTIVMQELALENQNREIEELRRQATAQPQGSGGLLSRMFGGGHEQQPARRAAPTMAGAGAASGPWNGQQAPMQVGQPGYAAQQQGRGGGGFLAGAAQTAMGVAGGVLLGSAIGGMFAGDAAVAAENPAVEPGAGAGAEEAAVEETGADEDGGFFDSFGGDEEF